MNRSWLWYLILLVGIGLYSCESDEIIELEEGQEVVQDKPQDEIGEDNSNDDTSNDENADEETTDEETTDEETTDEETTDEESTDDSNDLKPIKGNGVDIQEIMRLINDARTKGVTRNGTYYPPVGKVTWNKTLETVALQHSKDMVDNDFFSHTSSDGTSMAQRVKDANYDYRYVGENVAYGFPTEKAVVEAWLDSPGHCRNIMNKNYTEMGVGRYEDHWTQDFGTHK
ncbi:CAP domain-containing protein [Puteibacter caeruleilacunae]|nr:CAP domain-containing protein [Puteibacter caeruleilacunae]